MNIVPPLVFKYAIRFPDGLYFMGPRYQATDSAGRAVPVKKQRKIYDPLNRGPAKDAYTYTEGRATVVIIQNREAFAGCVVEKVL
jgi:hypothetical protein